MRFMCTHTLPPHAVTIDQARELAKMAQSDPNVRGYRSFMNLSAGKVLCIMEAKNEKAITDWFKKMNLPYDSVTPVEYEGDRGTIREEAGVHASV